MWDLSGSRRPKVASSECSILDTQHSCHAYQHAANTRQVLTPYKAKGTGKAACVENLSEAYLDMQSSVQTQEEVPVLDQAS